MSESKIGQLLAKMESADSICFMVIKQNQDNKKFVRAICKSDDKYFSDYFIAPEKFKGNAKDLIGKNGSQLFDLGFRSTTGGLTQAELDKLVQTSPNEVLVKDS